MDIKGFFKRRWNAITDKVSAKLNAVADNLAARLDARFRENHPITAGLLEDFGISPSMLLNEMWNGFLYTSKSAAMGLVDVARGVKDVTVTFLPYPSISSLTQWIPPVMRITWHPAVRTSFFRGVSRNLLFSVAATGFLRWPELAYQQFMRRPEEKENPYGTEFYWLMGANVVLAFMLIRDPISKYVRYLIVDDILEGMLFSDSAAKSMIGPTFPPAFLEKMNTSSNGTATTVPVDIQSIERIVSTKIFTKLEVLIKDGLMIGARAFNDAMFGSRFIAGMIWVGRAYIYGKDTATGQLSMLGASNTQLRRLLGDQKCYSLGKGIVLFSLGEVGSMLFYRSTGLGDIPIVTWPINLAISSLIYKIAMASAYTTRLRTVSDSPGVVFADFYGPAIVDPFLGFSEKIVRNLLQRGSERKARIAVQKQVVEVKRTAEDVQVAAANRLTFWEKLRKRRPTKTEQAFLRIYAGKLIYWLSVVKEGRKSKADLVVNLISLTFPPRLHNIVQVCLQRLTNDEVDRAIQFLIGDPWVDVVKNPTLFSRIKQYITEFLNNAEEDIEVCNVSEAELDAIAEAVAENFQLYQGFESNQGRVSAISRVKETFSAPVRQLLTYLDQATQQVLAHIEAVRQAGIIQTVANSASAVKTFVDGVPGGSVALTATGFAAAAVGSPVAVGIGVAVTGMQMVANNADTIQVGAQALQNVVTNLSSATNGATSNESNTVAVASPSMLHQFESYMGSAAQYCADTVMTSTAYVASAATSAAAVVDYQTHRVINLFTPSDLKESSNKPKRA